MLRLAVCEYCLIDGGCAHDIAGWHKTACKCSLSGPSKCEECGCDCAPWYQGMDIPGKEGLSGWLTDFAEGNNYPATKGALVGYLKANSVEEAGWVSDNLPDRSFRDPGDVMIALVPIIQSPTDSSMLAKSPLKTVASGMKLIVKEGEAAVMLDSKSSSTCDVLTTGSYSLSPGNCPLLASKSRRSDEGFDRLVLQGSPLFISMKSELQLQCTAMGQTATGKPGGAKGTIKLSVQSPKELASFVSSGKSGYADSSLTKLLTDRFNAALRGAIAESQLDTMKNDNSALEKQLTESAAQIGLKAIVTLDYAGEPTPDLAFGMMGDMAARMAAAQEAMKMAQQRRQPGMGGTPPRAQASASGYSQGTSQQAGIVCPKCNYKNPPAMKFCNNCGAPLGIKNCSQCGTDNSPTVNFCGNCGAKLQ